MHALAGLKQAVAVFHWKSTASDDQNRMQAGRPDRFSLPDSRMKGPDPAGFGFDTSTHARLHVQ